MKNGYYLSVYIAINELSYLTNFALRGDQNISLWYVENENVKLVHYWEVERLTGMKGHDRSFIDIESAKSFINDLLRKYNLTLGDMQEVWGTPELDTSNDYHSLLDYPKLSYHSISHLFSALMLDTDIFYNENILALAADAGPDMVVDKEKDSKQYYSGCYIERGEIKDIFPISSPGPMWATCKNTLGMREGALMALETATNCEMDNIVFANGQAEEIVTANNVKVDIADFQDKVNEAFNDKKYHDYDYKFTEEENKISMLMKEIDKQSLRIIDRTIKENIEKYNINTKETYFAITGGYGLNCPANSYFMKKYKFKGYIAPPCVNDGGLSLGIALYAFYKKMDKVSFKFRNAFYGDTDNIQSKELKGQYGDFISNISEFKPSDVVDDIMKEPVVWFQGAAEVGPRALGHRSILANACNLESKYELNKIKQRKWWRPVAPIVLEEEVNNWFENAYAAPYMLQTFNLKDEKRNVVPAIEHMNSSCRVQTINKEDDSLLYYVISALNDKYGVPIICNTSLNDKEEPIINTVSEVINFILRKGIKIAYINNYRIEFKNHELYKETDVADRKYHHLFQFSKKEIDERIEKINPYGIPRDQLAVYLFSPKLYERFSLKKKSDVRMIKMLTELAKAEHPTINYGGINTGCS